MNPEDDPEARIRALEQPLSDQALASELGGGHGADTAYLPPPAAAYSPPDYTTPAYGNQQWGQGAAIAFVLFAIIIVCTLAQRWILRDRDVTSERRQRRANMRVYRQRMRAEPTGGRR